MFTFYLDHVLRRDTERFCANKERDYSSRPDLMPLHVEYTDDVVFILTKPVENVPAIVTDVKKILEDFNLILYEEKTKKPIYRTKTT